MGVKQLKKTKILAAGLIAGQIASFYGLQYQYDQEKEKHMQRINSIKKQNEAFSQSIEQLKKENASLTVEIKALKEANQHIKEANHHIKEQNVRLKKEVEEMKNQVGEIKKQVSPIVSRGYKVQKTIRVKATAYTPYCQGCIGKTKWKEIDVRKNPHQKIIAVDPSIIPLGSKVYVEGYGLAIAADIGGGIKNYEIDILVPTEQEAISWGVKYVDVKILDTQN